MSSLWHRTTILRKSIHSFLKREYSSSNHHSGDGGNNSISPSSNSFEPITGPKSPSDTIGHPYERTVGIERLEYLSKLSKRPLYLMDPLVVDHFGTPSNPIMVESVTGQRIVGCTGYPKDSHEINWFWVTQEHPHKDYLGVDRCAVCGQAFKIDRVDDHNSHH